MIYCVKCKVEKEDNNFYKSTCWMTGTRGYCKECRRMYSVGMSTEERRATASYHSEWAKKYWREKWKAKQ